MTEPLGRRISSWIPVAIAKRTQEILVRNRTPAEASWPNPLRAFSNLKIRPKFIILHNLFFLVLTAATYFSLIPAIDDRLAAARSREVAMVTRGLLQDRLAEGLGYPHAAGTAEKLRIPTEAVKFLDENPARVYRERSATGELLYVQTVPGSYTRVEIPADFYDDIRFRLRLTLFVVLGAIYVLAILILEGFIMPRFVFAPIRLFLDADEAVRRGERHNELIEEEKIINDEIGEIMASRNAVVKALRSHEDELAATLAELEAQDRLASLGLLSASVAHELNTPLAVLQGSIEQMAERSTDPVQNERFARMLRVTQRIRRISESLLDFARVRRDVPEPVRLRPLIEEAWELLAIEDKAAHTRFDNRVPEIATVVGSADRLIQVWVNLLRNALNAMDDGGAITVSCRPVHEAGRRMLAVTFEDSGPGIAPEVLPALFNAFVSTRLDSRGTGLGLTIAEGIVAQHGGTISAMNRPEGGACIEVRLPSA